MTQFTDRLGGLGLGVWDGGTSGLDEKKGVRSGVEPSTRDRAPADGAGSIPVELSGRGLDQGQDQRLSPEPQVTAFSTGFELIRQQYAARLPLASKVVGVGNTLGAAIRRRRQYSLPPALSCFPLQCASVRA